MCAGVVTDPSPLCDAVSNTNCSQDGVTKYTITLCNETMDDNCQSSVTMADVESTQPEQESSVMLENINTTANTTQFNTTTFCDSTKLGSENTTLCSSMIQNNTTDPTKLNDSFEDSLVNATEDTINSAYDTLQPTTNQTEIENIVWYNIFERPLYTIHTGYGETNPNLTTFESEYPIEYEDMDGQDKQNAHIDNYDDYIDDKIVADHPNYKIKITEIKKEIVVMPQYTEDSNSAERITNVVWDRNWLHLFLPKLIYKREINATNSEMMKDDIEAKNNTSDNSLDQLVDFYSPTNDTKMSMFFNELYRWD